MTLLKLLAAAAVLVVAMTPDASAHKPLGPDIAWDAQGVKLSYKTCTTKVDYRFLDAQGQALAEAADIWTASDGTHVRITPRQYPAQSNHIDITLNCR